MKPNNPFFADLSTYSPEEAIPFYEKTFGWKYYGNDDYYIAFSDNKEVAGLYETPEKFQQMQMPHFWMTYIQVESVAETIEKAKILYGTIELVNEMGGSGKIALIRDPEGAGFCVYEGDQLKNTRTKDRANTLIWNELHISDSGKVIPFYHGIFDWKITKSGQGHFIVLNHKDQHIADILELPDVQRGKYKYWVCTFGVEDLYKSKSQILENGGSQISSDGNRILFTDNSNEAFFYLKAV